MVTKGQVSALILLLLLSAKDDPGVAAAEDDADRGPRTSTVSFATFNIQNLGPSKMADNRTVRVLTQILSRYDLIAIQEVQDKSGKAILALKRSLNAAAASSKSKYDVVVSDRVGAKPGEVEQYALFYRPRVAKVLRAQHYDDPDGVYSRTPFLTTVQFRISGLPTTVVVNLHARPDPSRNKTTVSEVHHLVDVYDYVRKKLDIPNVLMAGDWNADGRYVTKRDWARVGSRTRSDFLWLVQDDDDTTVGDNTDMAYDRIVAVGKALQASIVSDSARVFRFDDELSHSGMPMTKEQAQDVSDHYPVQVELRPTTDRPAKKPWK